jgi:hypothetical protein
LQDQQCRATGVSASSKSPWNPHSDTVFAVAPEM